MYPRGSTEISCDENLARLANGEAWKPKDLWKYLKSGYTLKHWSAKRASFNRLEEIDYEKT